MKPPKHLSKTWPKSVNEVLKDAHLADLRKSGLSDQTILEARIYSVNSQESRFLLNRKTEIGPGCVFPYPAKTGFLEKDINFKPDVPLPSLQKKEKSRKYVRPIGVKSRLFIPRPVWPVLNDISIPLFVTEGEKKCLKGCQESFLTIGISGVWNWSSNRQPLDDFKLILLEGREVFIVFDSDKQRNINVLKAETKLADFLSSKKSIVKIVDLPEEDA